METDKIPATHSECGKHTYGVGSTVLQESARDHLQCLAYSTVRPLLHPCHTLCPLIEGLCQGHFCCPTPWHQVGVCDYVPCHLHCILEITIHLGGGGGRGRREGGGGRGEEGGGRREGEEGGGRREGGGGRGEEGGGRREGGGGRGRRERGEKREKELINFTHFLSHTHTHTSWRMSLLAPRSTMVQALGSRHSTRYVKYSSPIFRTSKRPHPVPMSDSFTSSVRLHIVAPHALCVVHVWCVCVWYMCMSKELKPTEIETR